MGPDLLRGGEGTPLSSQPTSNMGSTPAEVEGTKATDRQHTAVHKGAKGETVGDVIQQAQTGQTQRLGVIVLTSNGQQMTVNLDPSKPLLAAGKTPTNTTMGTNDKLQIQLQDTKGNPWFGPNFFAAFNAAESEYLRMKSKESYYSGVTSMKVAKQTLDMSKTIADLDKANYDNQAQQKITEAIQQFVSVGVSAMQLASQMSNYARARAETADYEGQVNKAQVDLDGKRAALNNPAVAPHANDLNQVRENAQSEVSKAEAKLEQAKINRDSAIQSRVKHLDEITSIKYNMINSINKGAADMVIAGLMQTQGDIVKAKDIMEGQKQVMLKYAEDAGRQQNDASAAFDEAIRMLQKFQDARIKGWNV